MTRPVKCERGPWSQGRPCPPGSPNTGADPCSGGGDAPVNKPNHPTYWNDDPCTRWLGPMNMGYALIDGHWERVLIDSGAQGNAMSPEYMKEYSLKVSQVHKLASNQASIPVSGIGGHMTALGYVIQHPNRGHTKLQ